MSRAHGQNSGLFSIAPGVEPETRNIDRRSVTSLTQLRHRSSRPRAPARNHLVALEPGPEPSVDAESDACEFVRSKSLWNQTDSGFLGCGFAADKFGDRGGGGRRRLTRPLALDGDSTFQTAATRRHGFSISRRDLPEVCQQCPYPPKQRAQGIPGARCTRGPVSKLHKTKRPRAYRFSGGNPAFPAQWFEQLIRALPGDQALGCHRHRRCPNRRLDASLEASGPHAFAVRLTRHSSKARSTATASPSRAVDVAQRPSEWDGISEI